MSGGAWHPRVCINGRWIEAKTWIPSYSSPEDPPAGMMAGAGPPMPREYVDLMRSLDALGAIIREQQKVVTGYYEDASHVQRSPHEAQIEAVAEERRKEFQDFMQHVVFEKWGLAHLSESHEEAAIRVMKQLYAQANS